MYKHALLGQYVKDPEHCAEKELVVAFTPHLVHLRDKYPKSRFHHLIIARTDTLQAGIQHTKNGVSNSSEDKESIRKPPMSIAHLQRAHLPLLHAFQNLAETIVSESDLPQSAFQIGFHAIPSLYPLHLHIMSRDFDSPHLKTKHHWQSFTTPHFVPLREVMAHLELEGKVPDQQARWQHYLTSSTFFCPSCGDTSFPTLARVRKHYATCYHPDRPPAPYPIEEVEKAIQSPAKVTLKDFFKVAK